MMLRFGKDTVTVVSQAQTGIDGTGTAILTTTSTDVPGCRHRPLRPRTAGGGGMARQQEGTEVGVSVATAWWETTAPPTAAMLAITPADSLTVNGKTYQIISGAKAFSDGMGNIIKVTILSEEQTVGF